MTRPLSSSFLALLLVLAVAACAPPEQAPPQQVAPEPAVDVAAEEQTIRDLSMNWLEAAQARDGATIDALFAQDVVTIFDGQILEGQAEIAADREAEWAENPDSTTNWTTSAVQVASSGDLAYERGSWAFDPDGPGEAAEEYGEYVTVWKKVGGDWRVAVDAGTTLNGEEEEE